MCFTSLKATLRHALLPIFLAGAVMAEPTVIVDLAQDPRSEDWDMFTDRVMGGVSTGDARIAEGAITLSGTVSTANNGGFIQARLSPVTLPEGTTRLVARVRGDGQLYYLHLRTTGTRLPWQYYQAPFVASPGWSEVTVPLSSFTPSGRMMRGAPRPGSVRSVALVAYGRDHEATVSLSSLRAE